MNHLNKNKKLTTTTKKKDENNCFVPKEIDVFDWDTYGIDERLSIRLQLKNWIFMQFNLEKANKR